MLVLACPPSCGDDSADGERPDRVISAEECNQGCDTSIGCPNDDPNRCLAACDRLNQAVRLYPQCGDELRRLVDCGFAQPLENHECDAEGETNLKDEFCYTQFSTWGACVEQARESR